jgi:hypothetical protein
MIVKKQRTMSFTAREEFYAMVEKFAQANNIGLSEAVRRLIVKGLDNSMPKPAEPPRKKEPFADLQDFHALLRQLKGVDPQMDTATMSPGTCITLYEVFRAGKHGAYAEGIKK